MKIELEPTDDFYAAQSIGPNDGGGLLPARLWIGKTETGVAIHAWILAVSPQTHDPVVAEQFGRELVERTVVVADKPDATIAFAPGSRQ